LLLVVVVGIEDARVLLVLVAAFRTLSLPRLSRWGQSRRGLSWLRLSLELVREGRKPRGDFGAEGDLRVGDIGAAHLGLALDDQRLRELEGLGEGARSPQALIDVRLAEVRPLRFVRAAERGLVGGGRGDDE